MAIPPNPRYRIEPAAIRQAADQDGVRTAANFAPPALAAEPYPLAEFLPVWRIKRTRLVADRHCLDRDLSQTEEQGHGAVDSHHGRVAEQGR